MRFNIEVDELLRDELERGDENSNSIIVHGSESEEDCTTQDVKPVLNRIQFLTQCVLIIVISLLFNYMYCHAGKR